MLDLLEKLLNEEVTFDELFLSWSDGGYKNDGQDICKEVLVEFIPYFLSYLRDCTNNILQANGYITSTPNKSLNHRNNTKPNVSCKSNNEKKDSNSKVNSLHFYADNCKGLEVKDAAPLHKQNDQYDNSCRRTSWSATNYELKCEKGKVGNIKKANWSLNKTESSEIYNINDEMQFPSMTTEKRERNFAKRRIKPTCLSSTLAEENIFTKNNNSSFLFDNESAKIFGEAKEIDSLPIEMERKWLKEQKHTKPITVDNNFFPLNFSLKSSNGMKSKNNSDVLQVNEITSRKELDALSKFYSKIILNNYAPNIMVEMYFLFQLLTLNINSECCEDKNEHLFECFRSIHNCIYFAVNCLSNLIDLIMLLDKKTLKILSENTCIDSLCPSLKNQIVRQIQELNVSGNTICVPKSPIENVPFQANTDTKNNFPNNASCTLFKMQRDIFYNVLKQWEENHMLPDWSFEHNLTEEILRIFPIDCPPTNYVHFAYLFQSQLLTMCRGDLTSKQSLANIEAQGCLKQLKLEDPHKLKCLQTRLTRPATFGGPAPNPSFSGKEEFFQQFIFTASNTYLLQHLKDVFISEIKDLSGQNFCLEDSQESGELQEKIWSSIETLLILAKFLGYILFLPYATQEHIPPNILTSQALLRSGTEFSVNLSEVLQVSAAEGKLMMCIPWLVQLLSMADAVSLYSKYLLTVICQLIFLYKNLYITGKCVDCSASCLKMGPSNCLLTKLCLGWFFSLPAFPKGIFYCAPEDTMIDLKQYQAFTALVLRLYWRCGREYGVGAVEGCRSLYNQQDKTVLSPPKREKQQSNALNCGTPKTKMFVTPKKSYGASEKYSTPMDKYCQLSPLRTPSKYFYGLSTLASPIGTPDKFGGVDSTQSSVVDKFVLDEWHIATHQLISLCCPFFGELHNVLNNSVNGAKKLHNKQQNNYKKITLLSASHIHCNLPQKKLQTQMEEYFFSNKPSSVKKCVTFMVDILLSNIVKELRSSIMIAQRQSSINKMKEYLSNHSLHLNVTLSIGLEKTASTLSISDSETIRLAAQDVTQEALTDSRIKHSLDFMLNELTRKSKEVCEKILERILNEKLNSWLNLNASPSVLATELIKEGSKMIKLAQKPFLNDNVIIEKSLSAYSRSNASFSGFDASDDNKICCTNNTNEEIISLQDIHSSLVMSNPTKEPCLAQTHDLNFMSPSDLLKKLKLLVRDLIKKGSNCVDVTSEKEMLHLPQIIIQSMKNRMDFTSDSYKAVEALYAEVICALVVNEPHVATKSVLESACNLWKENHKHEVFKNSNKLIAVLSHRNIKALEHYSKKHIQESWQAMDRMLLYIVLELQVLPLVQLQDAFIVLLRYSWSDEVLAGMTQSIESIFKRLQVNSQFRSELHDLDMMEWVAWATSNMDVL